jgi:predicted nucleotidyltransferase
MSKRMTEGPGVAANLQAPPAVKNYVAEVVTACNERGVLASVVVFGSSATGGYQERTSDVDLLLVLGDRATHADRQRVEHIVAELEVRHGVGKQESPRHGRLARALKGFADRLTANQRSAFICTRADLLSGEPRRILSLPRAQAALLDRVAIPSIVGSGVTVWGEDLLDLVPLPPIRRFDVVKAFFGLCNVVLLAAATFPVLPEATKYAMDALKRSVHNCYFSHNGRPASLADEVAYFEQRYGSSVALRQLLSLRQEYRSSWRFVSGCFFTVFKLHLRTARDVTFPRDVRRSEMDTANGVSGKGNG